VKGIVVVEAPLQQPAGKSWAPQVAALAPVVNRPLLTSAVETLARAGADEVVVVADRRSLPRLRSSIAGGGVGADVSWLGTEDQPTVGQALLHAAPLVAGHRLAVHTTSGLWLRGRGALVQALATSDLDALLFRGSAVGPVHSGIYSFSPAILDALRATSGDGPGADVLDAVDVLARDGGRVEAAAAEGWWSYSGGSQNLLEANRMALDELDPVDWPCPERTQSRIQGRVQVHPTAHVTRSVIRGPVVIGAHATVVDAYVGPYTTIGDAVTIENAEVEASILLTGARLHDLGVRVEDSIVGQGATITRGFDLPRAVRLLVGDDARVTLA
jgi:glucose-1-phosphate thymidylyltransferase